MSRTPRLKVALEEGTRAELDLVVDLLGVPASTAAAVLIECGLTVGMSDLREARDRLVRARMERENPGGPKKETAYTKGKPGK